jgi:hypothetical protein
VLTVLLSLLPSLNCILHLVFRFLFKLLLHWQCCAVANWCNLCRGTPRFSYGVLIVDNTVFHILAQH